MSRYNDLFNVLNFMKTNPDDDGSDVRHASTDAIDHSMRLFTSEWSDLPVPHIVFPGTEGEVVFEWHLDQIFVAFVDAEKIDWVSGSLEKLRGASSKS